MSMKSIQSLPLFEGHFKRAWRDYLISELAYSQTQIRNAGAPFEIEVYRDSAHSECLALITISISSEEEAHYTAVAQGAEFVVVGEVDNHAIYHVASYGLARADIKAFPAWLPSIRSRGPVNRKFQLLPFRDESQLRRALTACHDAVYFASAKDPAAAFDQISLIIAAKVMDEQFQ